MTRTMAKVFILHQRTGVIVTKMLTSDTMFKTCNEPDMVSMFEIRKIHDVGNRVSRSVVIPAAIANRMQIHKGDYIKISYHPEKNHIHLEKVVGMEKP